MTTALDTVNNKERYTVLKLYGTMSTPNILDEKCLYRQAQDSCNVTTNYTDISEVGQKILAK